MTLEQESRRGEQARRLLEDPLLQEAFSVIDAALRDAWVTTVDDAPDERERLWLMLKLLGRVRAQIVNVLETGKLADEQLRILAS
jgi:ABC-type thiamine transport system ATPase subunit